MQYTPESEMPPAVGRQLRPRVRRAVLDELDRPDAGGTDLMGPTGPKSGNTGIAAPSPSAIEPAPAPSAPAPADFSTGALLPVLRKYEHTPDGLAKAFAENPQWGAAGAKIQGGDIFNPQTGRWLDVIRGASRGGEDWQYLDEQEGGADYSPQQGGAMRGMDPAMTSIIEQIRKSILALMGNQ